MLCVNEKFDPIDGDETVSLNETVCPRRGLKMSSSVAAGIVCTESGVADRRRVDRIEIGVAVCEERRSEAVPLRPGRASDIRNRYRGLRHVAARAAFELEAGPVARSVQIVVGVSDRAVETLTGDA